MNSAPEPPEKQVRGSHPSVQEWWRRVRPDDAGQLLILVAVVVVCLGLYPAGSVALDTTGNPRGLLAAFREGIQGKRFWREQVTRIDEEMAKTKRGMEELERILNFRLNPELTSQMNEMREQLVRQYPQLQPSAAQQQAAALREAADEIERTEEINKLKALYLDRLTTLSQLRAIAVARSTSETNRGR